MRKYFFSAMALVLGLFTVTAVFAFTFSDSSSLRQDNEFYLKENLPDPEEDWKNPDNWNENPSTPPNCSSGDHPCRVTLPQETDFEKYIEELIASNVEYEDLVDRPEIDPRLTMP